LRPIKLTLRPIPGATRQPPIAISAQAARDHQHKSSS
jgi:hypothetical protein